MKKQLIIGMAAMLGLSVALARPSFAEDGDGGACDIPRSVVNTLQSQLASVVQVSNHNGGIFSPNRMWSAVVDRKGRLCSVTKIGDSACTDHAIAYRMRHQAGSLDGIPGGVGPGGTDNIAYLAAGEAPNGFRHPHCFPTDITP